MSRYRKRRFRCNSCLCYSSTRVFPGSLMGFFLFCWLLHVYGCLFNSSLFNTFVNCTRVSSNRTFTSNSCFSYSCSNLRLFHFGWFLDGNSCFFYSTLLYTFVNDSQVSSHWALACYSGFIYSGSSFRLLYFCRFGCFDFIHIIFGILVALFISESSTT